MEKLEVNAFRHYVKGLIDNADESEEFRHPSKLKMKTRV